MPFLLTSSIPLVYHRTVSDRIWEQEVVSSNLTAPTS